jgi:Arc/MetJ-type ribon-helix-helix transcriptional regulator
VSFVKRIRIQVPEQVLEHVDELVTKGFYANRREAITAAIKDMLIEHDEFRHIDIREELRKT